MTFGIAPMTYDYPHFGPLGFDDPIWLAVAICFWVVSCSLVLLTLALFGRALWGISCSRWMKAGWVGGLVVEFSLWLLATLIPELSPQTADMMTLAGVVTGGCCLMSLSLSLMAVGTDVNLTISHAMTVMGWAAVVAALLFVASMPGVNSGPVSKRSQCKNNLKQVGLAFTNIKQVNGRLVDQASREDPIRHVSGAPPHSWRIAIAPYIDQAPLYSQYRFDRTWDSAENEEFALYNLAVYRCPSLPERLSRDAHRRYYTAYAIVTGNGTAYPQGQGLKLQQITDGQSTTATVVEACGQQIVWTEPRDITLAALNVGVNLPGKQPYSSPGVWSSFHAQGAHTLFADGSVRFISQATDPAVLKALLTATGGDAVGDF